MIVFVFVVICAVLVSHYTGNLCCICRKVKEIYYGKPGCIPLPNPGNVTLHYFGVRGKAEGIRFIMEEGGISYDETKFTKATWPAAKAKGVESGLYPFGQVPALITSTGSKVAQSLVVAHFVARSTGLDCDCRDYQRCEMLVQGIEDIKYHFGLLIKHADYDFARRKEFIDNVLPVWLKHFEKLAPSLTQQDGAFFASNRITWVDLLVFEVLNQQITYAADDFGGKTYKNTEILKQSPKLANFYRQMLKRDRIDAYLQSERRHPFTHFAKPKEVRT
ncbi:DgyrCDS5215 [Dimorphilus gyrociliatus]|uniref:DgyrCDS5215 n=1 Tax=Dimorphilus gyrociliatus TaxID=2664684 RepID=A0A7I8VLI8_9ANNE|nr:DgyrCDS5215 [Dimorphilus gyrociliatus]